MIFIGLSNREVIELHRKRSHINTNSLIKMRARSQARQVVVKTLGTFTINNRNFL
jgi:hypothetical protein